MDTIIIEPDEAVAATLEVTIIVPRKKRVKAQNLIDNYDLDFLMEGLVYALLTDGVDEARTIVQVK
jgi:hypothetical protein